MAVPAFESSTAKIVNPRHVLPNELQESTIMANDTLCLSQSMPDISSYVTALDIYGQVLFSFGAVAVLFLLILYGEIMRKVLSHNSTMKTNTAFVLVVYPVVSLASFCAMIVPRSQLLTEAIGQITFMVAMYHLFCMMITHCGGEEEFIRKAKPLHLETRVLPCCCWPCCKLPRPSVNKQTLLFLRLIVLQLPIVQGIIYFTLLVLYAEDENLYRQSFVYFQPLIVCSILSGVWGVIMTVRCATDVTEDDGTLREKFLALQFVLILTKFQGLLIRLMPVHYLPCKAPITPALYLNLIYHNVIIWEMVLLSFWAYRIYGREINVGTQHCLKDAEKTQEKIENGHIKEGNTNNNFVDD